MFTELFETGSLDTGDQADADYVQDVAYSFLGRLDQAGIVTDTNGVVRYLNEAASRLTAWSEADAVGTPINSVVKLTGDANGRHMEDHVARTLGKVMATPLGVNTVLRRADGTQVSVEGSVAPVQGRDNRIVGALVLLQDVTQLRPPTDSPSHDALTGLANRREDQPRLETTATGAHTHTEKPALHDDHVRAFNPDDIELDQRQQEMQLFSRISTALDENRFVLYYQPIIPVCASHNNIQHREILVRMVNTDGTLAQPAQFIPAAERCNLMPALDRWIIKRVFEAFHTRYPTRELKRTQLWSINISGASLSSENFFDFIRDHAAQYEIEPQSICFEITETAAIADIERVSKFLWGLRIDGFRIALDDFGIGMSSFAYLKSLPVDYVKIEGEFVKNILDEKVSLAMTEAITRISCVMGIQTVAEYVENIAILEKLREIGVSYAQGYGISKPISLEETAPDSSLAELNMGEQRLVA
jgi:PAS domain S-box-containing protein